MHPSLSTPVLDRNALNGTTPVGPIASCGAIVRRVIHTSRGSSSGFPTTICATSLLPVLYLYKHIMIIACVIALLPGTDLIWSVTFLCDSVDGTIQVCDQVTRILVPAILYCVSGPTQFTAARDVAGGFACVFPCDESSNMIRKNYGRGALRSRVIMWTGFCKINSVVISMICHHFPDSLTVLDLLDLVWISPF